MKSIAKFIAELGVNQNWIAANAHFWFAMSFILLAHGSIFAAIAFLVIAGLKEFWFDATFEEPKQSFEDNAIDFTEYALGIVFGFFLSGVL